MKMRIKNFTVQCIATLTIAVMFYSAPVYSNGLGIYGTHCCEDTQPMSQRGATSIDYTINSLELVQSADGSSYIPEGNDILKLDIEMEGEGNLVFEVPIKEPMEPDKKYYASGKVYVHTFEPEKPIAAPPDHSSFKVALGYWVQYRSDCNSNSDDLTIGSYFQYTDTSSNDSDPDSNDEWLIWESEEINAESNEIPAECAYLDNIILGFYGNFPKGSRAIVYIDDLKISETPATEPRPVTTAHYPIVEENFVFGMTGALSGLLGSNNPASTYNEKFPESSWRDIPLWRDSYINATISNQLVCHSDATSFDNLAETLDIYEQNNLWAIPQVYLTPYYWHVTRDYCATTIRTEFQRLKFPESPALLAWYLIDEPQGGKGALDDYLWGAHQIAQYDSVHPVTTGGIGYDSLFLRHRPVSIFDKYPINRYERNPWSIGPLVSSTRQAAFGPIWFIAQAFAHNEHRQPTPGELQLMSYLALANGAKGLIYHAWFAIVDPFGVDNGLLATIKELGQHLTTIGPMLLNATPIPCNVMDSVNAPIYMITPTTTTIPDGPFYEKDVPIIDIGLLADNDKGDVHYMIIYNNKTDEISSEDFQFTTEFIAGRDMFDLYEPRNTGNPTVANFTLGPGEGRIFMIAPNADYLAVQDQILAARLAHEKEMIQYEMYFAYLADLVPPELIDQFLTATTSAEMEEMKKALNEAIAADPNYIAMRNDLDMCQATLSEIDKKCKENTSGIDEYCSQMTVLGHIYLTARNLFLRGTLHQNDSDQNNLYIKDLIDRFSSHYANPFCYYKTQQLDWDELNSLRGELDDLLTNATLRYPNPTTMFYTENCAEEDTMPPEISLSVSPDTLWPPNHKMVSITVTVTANDACDPNPNVVLKSITMNEGDKTNTYDPNFDETVGDGDTIDDIMVDAEGNISLRSERSGTGSGRVYTITYEATDASGNAATAEATVTVPHSQ